MMSVMIKFENMPHSFILIVVMNTTYFHCLMFPVTDFVQQPLTKCYFCVLNIGASTQARGFYGRIPNCPGIFVRVDICPGNPFVRAILSPLGEVR